MAVAIDMATGWLLFEGANNESGQIGLDSKSSKTN